MKKLLTLFVLMLITGVGAWAQNSTPSFEIAVSPGEGTFYRGTSSWNDTSRPWCSRFLSNDIEITDGVTTKVDISVTSPSYQNNYNHKDNNGFYVCPGANGCTYTVRLSNTAYVVKSITMTLNEAGGANATNIVIAGQIYARTNATTTPLTLTKVPATAFKVSGNNSFVKITDIRLEVAPFEVASNIANAKWFQLNVRGSYVVYDAASGTYHDTTTEQPSTLDPASWFTFVGSSKDDFKIVNYAAGFDKAMGADNVNTDTRLSAKDFASAQSFKIEEVTYQGTKGIQIREKNNANAFLNQQSTNLGYWNWNARGDYGNLFVINQVEGPVTGVADGIYEINNQSGSVSRGYFVHTESYPNAPVLAETQLSGYTNRDFTDDRHDGNVNPYFGVKTIEGKTYIYSLANGKFLNTSWSDTAVGYIVATSTRNPNYLTLQNTNQSGSQFLCNACGNNGGVAGHTIYTGNNDGGNDFVFETVTTDKATELRNTYAEQIARAEFAINGGWTVVSSGLQNSEVGGVCYNRVDYPGAKAQLPYTIDESALIAMHVSGYNGTVSVDDVTKTITVTYSDANETTSTLWHGNVATGSNQIIPASRIPAIITTNSGEILAFSDWRYNFNDIGRGDKGGHIDIEMRRSADGGQTWKPAIIAARGTGSGTTAGYGDAAVVADRTTAESQQILLLAAAGNVTYTANNRENSIRMAKFTSSDNGATWSEATDITSNIFAILPDNVKAFFATSGKVTQASFKAEGATHNRIYTVLCTTTDGGSTNTNYVIYSDDFGANWAVLGGTETPAMSGGNEAHVTELPGGDLLLDSRAGGRLVNLFTYSDKNSGAGTWGASGQKSITVGTACNGDIDVVDCYKAGTTEAVKVLIQSAPRASSRSNIRYYYKELPAQTDGHYTLSDFVGGWTEGYQVCAGSSAYSSITSAGAGVEYMLYEKNTNNNTFNYDIEFEKHNISDITGGVYLDHATVPVTINYTLTDVNGATYEGSCTGVEGTAPAFTGAYGYTLTNEQWGEVVDNAVSYTATINFPFPVSSNNVSKWVNLIYMPNFDRYISYDGTNDKMRQAYKEAAKNDPGTSKGQTNFIWSVTPVFDAENSGFGFQIYSKGANKYVSATGMAHQAQVALANTADVFQLVAPTATPASATHKNDNNGVFVKQNETATFSICTESATGRDFLTFWNVATSSHAGQNVAIVAAYDMQEYDALLAQVENTGTQVGQYSINEEGAAEKVAECRDNRDDMTKYYEHIAVMQEMTSRFVLNMPQAGHFYRIKASSTNKKAYTGVTDNQEIYLTSENSTATSYTGRAAFALTEGASSAANTIFYYADGKLIAYSNGLKPVSSSNFWKMGGVGDAGLPVNFEEIGRNTEVGAYRIEFNNGGRSLYTQRATLSGQTYYFTDAAGGNQNTAHYRYFLEEVESLPVLFKGVGHGFATLYSPVALDIPTELPSGYEEYSVTAYTTNIEQNNSLKVSAIEDGIIPANQGVVLNFANGEETLVEGENVIVNFPVTTENGSATSTLSGTYATVAADENSYVFALQNNKAGFYKYKEGTTGTLAGFKAYYDSTTNPATRGFALDFGEQGVVTAIEGLQTVDNGQQAAFDLAGRRVSAAQKGILIQNGNKVIR